MATINEKMTAIADAIRSKTGESSKLSLDAMAEAVTTLDGTNFKIVGGTTEPANPSENTIWVNTDTEITGWAFAPEDPYVRIEDFYESASIVASGYYLSPSGGHTTSADFSILKIDLPNNAKFVTIEASSTSVNTACHLFYDASNNPITADVVYVRATGMKSYEVPNEAASMQISFRNDDTQSFNVTYYENILEGDIWVHTGVSSPVAFNALKKNGIHIYPISAKQYISGEWVSVTAQTYHSGTWADWIIYYYKDGNSYNDITGGYTYNNNTTIEADNIKMYTDGDGSYAYATTNNKIDISGISTLSMKFNLKAVSSYSRTVRVYLYVSDNKLTDPTQSVGTGATVYKDYNEGTDMEDTIELDVSSITAGGKYIFVCTKNTGKYFQVTTNIKEIRGE